MTLEIASGDSGGSEGLSVRGSEFFARLGVVSETWASKATLAVKGVAGDVVEETLRLVVALSHRRLRRPEAEPMLPARRDRPFGEEGVDQGARSAAVSPEKATKDAVLLQWSAPTKQRRRSNADEVAPTKQPATRRRHQ